MSTNKYRVFISYSRSDSTEVKQIKELLERLGLEIWWDQNFFYGHGFSQQIKSFIRHAHVFIPIITENSSSRGWVQSEVGFAIAMNIPILPITWGDAVPLDLLQNLHAIKWMPGQGKFEKEISLSDVERLMKDTWTNSTALYENAPYHLDRTKMINERCKFVLDLNHAGVVRQKAHLSSFHLPTSALESEWNKSFPKGAGRRKDINEELRLEKELMEAHALQKGLKLIINPYITYRQKYKDPGLSQSVRKSRLTLLKKWLKDLSLDPALPCHIAVSKEVDKANIIMVGDWFLAETVSGSISGGYEQTIFTSHAPFIKDRIYRFDQELYGLLAHAGVSKEDSRDWVVGIIEQELKNGGA